MASVRVRKPKVLTREASEALAQQIFGLVSGPDAEVAVASTLNASISFARGDAHMMAEGNDVRVEVEVKGGQVETTRLDDAGLTAAIAEAEAAASTLGTDERPSRDLMGPQDYPEPPQRFFASVEKVMAAAARAELFRQALDATEAAGLIGAGDLNLGASSGLHMNTAGLFAYDAHTFGEFSLTARTKDGTGSGWAWTGHEDWTRADPHAVIAKAVDLAERSANPVAVEPGRYTVILEPAAVAELIRLRRSDRLASIVDQGGTVFLKDPEGNKIGLKMLDERLGMVFDPWDPDMPQRTFSEIGGYPVGKVVFFEGGVLKDLMYPPPPYAEEQNRESSLGPGGMRLFSHGPTQTLEEMIASTRRGIWVNRLSNVQLLDGRTLLKTGTTRDGTFLIENGKITKAIKNFRFDESAFYVLNQLEAVGEPVRASSSVVAPRVKVRDFNFTSLTDAV